MADAEPTTEAAPEPAEADPFLLLPAAIPGKALTMIGRNVKLIEALQAMVAKGIKQNAIAPVDAGRLVASLTRANDSLAKLHQTFEPRALNEGQKVLDAKSPVAQAAARKLMSMIDAEAVEVFDDEPAPELDPVKAAAAAKLRKLVAEEPRPETAQPAKPAKPAVLAQRRAGRIGGPTR